MYQQFEREETEEVSWNILGPKWQFRMSSTMFRVIGYKFLQQEVQDRIQTLAEYMIEKSWYFANLAQDLLGF